MIRPHFMIRRPKSKKFLIDGCEPSSHGSPSIFCFPKSALALACALRFFKLALRASASRILRSKVRCGRDCSVMPSLYARSLAKHKNLWQGSSIGKCCCSSVVEHIIGNDEVGSSILPSSTSLQKCSTFRDLCLQVGAFRV